VSGPLIGIWGYGDSALNFQLRHLFIWLWPALGWFERAVGQGLQLCDERIVTEWTADAFFQHDASGRTPLGRDRSR